MIYIMPGSEIYGYNFDTNTTSPLTVAGYTFDSPSIVHTNNKLYLYETVGSVTNIKEWVITTAPFAATPAGPAFGLSDEGPAFRFITFV